MTVTTEPAEFGIEDPPRTLPQAFLRIGPGLILAGAIVGTGELIATTNLGAQAGFALLWLVIVSCFIKVFVQVELGRYAISSGERTFQAFRRLPGPGVLLVWWCMLMVLVTQMQIGAMIGGVGQALHMAMPGVTAWLNGRLALLGPDVAAFANRRPELPWAVLTTAATIVMLISGSYKLVERATTVLVVCFTLMTVLCVVFLPGENAVTTSDIAEGLSFRIPPGVLVAAFMMFGITGVGASELLAYPYWCVEKGYARFVGPVEPSDAWRERARGWLRVLRLDAWVSMAIYTISTLAFYLLGAAILHGHTEGQGLPSRIGDVLDTLAKMYEPVMGPRVATGFIVVGSFAVLYSTLFAATAGNSRLLADFLRVNGWIDAVGELGFRRWVRVFCVLLPIAAFFLLLSVANPVLMVAFGGVMQGLSLPFIAAAAVYLRYRRTDRRIAPGLAWDVFLWMSLLGLTLAATYTLWTEVPKLLAQLGS